MVRAAVSRSSRSSAMTSRPTSNDVSRSLPTGASRETTARTPRSRSPPPDLRGRQCWFPVGGEPTWGFPDCTEGTYFGTEHSPDHLRVLDGTPLTACIGLRPPPAHSNGAYSTGSTHCGRLPMARCAASSVASGSRAVGRRRTHRPRRAHPAAPRSPWRTTGVRPERIADRPRPVVRRDHATDLARMWWWCRWSTTASRCRPRTARCTRRARCRSTAGSRPPRFRSPSSSSSATAAGSSTATSGLDAADQGGCVESA